MKSELTYFHERNEKLTSIINFKVVVDAQSTMKITLNRLVERVIVKGKIKLTFKNDTLSLKMVVDNLRM